MRFARCIPAVRALLIATERFLLPNACICCGGMIGRASPDDLVCGVCVSRMRTLGGGCGRCGQPLPPVGPCRFCADWTSELTAVHSAVWLGQEVRGIVHRLKYEHASRLADLAAAVIAARIPVAPGGVFLPVPVSPQRFRERGYNQAEVIARGLSRRSGIPVWSGVLRRNMQTTSQTALTPMGRTANVSNAFSAEPVSAAQVGERRAIIVDDVLTTGATVNACAGALAASGWRHIEAVTFARALPYEFHAN